MRHLAERIAPVALDAFVAAFPDAPRFVLDGGACTYLGAEPSSVLRDTPLEAVRAALSARATFDRHYPFPFRAGLVGYVGYELGQQLERLPCVERPSLGLPDLALAFHPWILATDRATGDTWLSIVADDPEPLRDHVLARLANASPTRHTERATEACATFGSACRVSHTACATFGSACRVSHTACATFGSACRVSHTANVIAWHSREEYLAAIARAKDHIFAGDVFEVCLTTAFDVPFDRAAAWPLFCTLQKDNPAPFAAFLDLPEAVIVSSSPERFLSLDAHGHAETRPIKGTRPRAATLAEDARLRDDLATSDKDRAENAMIVDLARNDLGRVCRFGSVVAPELYTVETFATVHQLVSTVRGELSPGNDAVDLLRACFPPGSMTGAPKIEAMAILEHLEPVERGPYAGALGWLDVGGAMDLSVVIRTAVIANGIARFAAGGAIVADSDPETEYEEMLLKTLAIREAMAR